MYLIIEIAVFVVFMVAFGTAMSLIQANKKK